MTDARDRRWSSRFIDAIINSLEINYLSFTDRTREEWRRLLIDKFNKHQLLDLASESDVGFFYQKQLLPEEIGLYVVSNKDLKGQPILINQQYVDGNVKESFSIILQGEGSSKSIYIVIDGKLSQDILFHEQSLSSIIMSVELPIGSSQVLPGDPLIIQSLQRASYTRFAEKVTLILQEITKDDHLSVGYYPELVQQNMESSLFKMEHLFSKDTAMNITVDAEKKARLAKLSGTFGFDDVPLDSDGRQIPLPPEVGYVKISELFNVLDPSMHMVKERLFDLMHRMEEKDTIILDLRNCGGGTPQGVAYISSFFFQEPTHLSTYIGQVPGGEPGKKYEERLETFTQEDLKPDESYPLVNLAEKKLFILINSHTFSAAEELAYDLQQFGKAQIVGTRSHGGNHVARGEPLFDKVDGDCNENFIIVVPTARSISEVSKTNWEDGPKSKGKAPGIIPDIPARKDENSLTSLLDLVFIRLMADSTFGQGTNTAKKLEKMSDGVSTAKLLSSMPHSRLSSPVCDSEQKPSTTQTQHQKQQDGIDPKDSTEKPSETGSQFHPAPFSTKLKK